MEASVEMQTILRANPYIFVFLASCVEGRAKDTLAPAFFIGDNHLPGIVTSACNRKLASYTKTSVHLQCYTWLLRDICNVLQATLVRNTTDENEARILYEYLAEASVVFPKVFPVM